MMEERGFYIFRQSCEEVTRKGFGARGSKLCGIHQMEWVEWGTLAEDKS